MSGKFSATFDATSTPSITELGGTVCALTEVESALPVPPRISGSGYNLPELPAYRATFSIDARGVSATAGALK